MKTIVSLIISAFFFCLMYAPVTAQDRGNSDPRVSPNASVSQTIGTTTVEVTYGRPGVRDRDIFGGLVPFNSVWRTGANESTAITFSDDVTVEGESVPAGTYSLYSIPSEDEWVIILNEKLSWGTQYDESMDFARVSVDPEESFYVEQLMIYFENVSEESAELNIHWDDTKVPVTIETAGGGMMDDDM